MQLVADGDDVSHGVDSVLRMDHVVVLEGAHHVDDAVHRLDVREEGVAQALALRGAEMRPAMSTTVTKAFTSLAGLCCFTSQSKRSSSMKARKRL